MMYLAKVALRREEGVPVGVPARLHLDCPCGAEVPVDRAREFVLCCRCGTAYTCDGWLMWRLDPIALVAQARAAGRSFECHAEAVLREVVGDPVPSVYVTALALAMSDVAHRVRHGR